MTMRSTPRDALFLRAALPVTGRRQRPEAHPFREPTVYGPEEERSLALDGIAHLPDREGYLWLKTRSPEAVRLRTRSLDLPDGQLFRRIIEAARRESHIGGRLSRETYEREILLRDRTWLGEEAADHTLEERMERAYRQAEIQR